MLWRVLWKSLHGNRQVNSEFTQQDGRKKRTANAWGWQTWQGYYLCVLSGIHLTLFFFSYLQKDLFKGMWSLAEGFFKQNCCHACHTRFAVVFPFSSCCVSSLMSYRGGSRGRVQGVRTLPWDNLRFSSTTGILQKKKTMWFIGVEVEQETSAPPPKKNPGSAIELRWNHDLMNLECMSKSLK